MVHKNDETHRQLDPYSNYSSGVITLADAASKTGQIVTLADGRKFNVHDLRKGLDGPAIGYGIRWEIR
jgi:hypothetical protein